MTDLVLERFWEKAIVDVNSKCWNWTSSKSHDGYGRFKVNGVKFMAHRFAYQVNKGMISKDRELDHLCRNRLCVNPDHLEQVTDRENTRRGFSPFGINSRRINCINGHPLTGDNLYIKPNGNRNCRMCRMESSKRQRSKNKA